MYNFKTVNFCFCKKDFKTIIDIIATFIIVSSIFEIFCILYKHLFELENIFAFINRYDDPNVNQENQNSFYNYNSNKYNIYKHNNYYYYYKNLKQFNENIIKINNDYFNKQIRKQQTIFFIILFIIDLLLIITSILLLLSNQYLKSVKYLVLFIISLIFAHLILFIILFSYHVIDLLVGRKIFKELSLEYDFKPPILIGSICLLKLLSLLYSFSSLYSYYNLESSSSSSSFSLENETHTIKFPSYSNPSFFEQKNFSSSSSSSLSSHSTLCSLMEQEKKNNDNNNKNKKNKNQTKKKPEIDFEIRKNPEDKFGISFAFSGDRDGYYNYKNNNNKL